MSLFDVFKKQPATIDPKALLDIGNTRSFNDYRRGKSATAIDLSGWDAKGKNVEWANFAGLDLTNVQNLHQAVGLGRTNLTRAKLSNQQCIDLLENQYVGAFNRYREHNPEVNIDLSGWDAEGKTLDNADLSNLDLRSVRNIEKAGSFKYATFNTHSRLTQEQVIALHNAGHGASADYLEARPWERPVEWNTYNPQYQRDEFQRHKEWRIEKGAQVDAKKLAEKLAAGKPSYLARVKKRADAILDTGLDPDRMGR